jgi:hypothetical protein
MIRPRPALVLAVAALLAGCSYGRSEQPPAGTPVTNQTRPPPTLSPNTTVMSRLPRLVGTEGKYLVFAVSPQQYELVDRNFYQVIIREKLWDEGVRFGAGFDQARQVHLILIDPGFSQLSARQILDRLLRS